ncbi:MAG: hypothetical protein KF764_16520 [Labilithrix sp.]|nr:hypothetical protein [Labilithrix sp.]
MTSARVGWGVGVVVLALVGLAMVGCSDDDKKAEPDAAGACKDMCSGIGFATSRVDVKPSETNCFCSGAGTVTQDECTKMCTAIGRGSAHPFRSGAAVGDDACRCQ